MRDLIRRCQGEEVLDRDLAWYLQEEHACRVIAYLSEEAPRVLSTARRRGRDEDEDEDDVEDDTVEDPPSPPPKRTRLSAAEAVEVSDTPTPPVGAGRNPFAQGQLEQVGESP